MECQSPFKTSGCGRDAKEIRHNVISRHMERHAADAELDYEVRMLLLDEVRRGRVQGRFAGQELSDILGHSWIPSLRFGVRQTDKTRQDLWMSTV